jgi:hypothetical protein
MEAILMDLKRVMRSILRSLHAVSGAARLNGVKSDSRFELRWSRPVSTERTMSDMYGRTGRPDIYSGREMLEYYTRLAYGENATFQ